MTAQPPPAHAAGPGPQRGATPPPPGHRPEDYPTSASRDGRIAWALGLLCLVPIPGFAALLAGILMVMTGLLQAGKNPVAKKVGRNAAIYGATLLVAVVVFSVLLGIEVATRDPDRPASAMDPLFLLAAPFGLWMTTLGPLVGVIMGVIGLAMPVSREKAARILAGR